MFYFNMEPRLKWNKIIFWPLKQFISFQMWRLKWNKINLAAKIFLFYMYFRRGSMLKWNTKILLNDFILTRNHGLRLAQRIRCKFNKFSQNLQFYRTMPNHCTDEGKFGVEQ